MKRSGSELFERPSGKMNGLRHTPTAGCWWLLGMHATAVLLHGLLHYSMLLNARTELRLRLAALLLPALSKHPQSSSCTLLLPARFTAHAPLQL